MFFQPGAGALENRQHSKITKIGPFSSGERSFLGKIARFSAEKGGFPNRLIWNTGARGVNLA
jgi:hypothetical protein